MSDKPTLLVVCGSRRRPSRTRELASHAVKLARKRDVAVDLLDLREHPIELFDGRERGDYDHMTNETVSMFVDTDMYLVASPVYFGAIPGALKNLIDHVPYETFQQRPRSGGLLLTGRDERHKFTLDSQLRSILVYLGVAVATPNAFATENDFEQFTLETEAVRERIDAVLAETIRCYECQLSG